MHKRRSKDRAANRRNETRNTIRCLGNDSNSGHQSPQRAHADPGSDGQAKADLPRYLCTYIHTYVRTTRRRCAFMADLMMGRACLLFTSPLDQSPTPPSMQPTLPNLHSLSSCCREGRKGHAVRSLHGHVAQGQTLDDVERVGGIGTGVGRTSLLCIRRYS